jgi:hypothetical protein
MFKRTPPRDAGLQQIDDLEALIIRAHVQKAQYGVSVEEVARGRPAVVAQAHAICNQLRDAHRARSQR